MKSQNKSYPVFLLTFFLSFACFSAEPAAQRFSYISIIIDDLGYRLHDDLRAVALPGPVVCAIMPHAPYSSQLAYLAHKQGKDIILHQPLQALKNNELLGPGALTLDMTKQEFTRTFESNIDSLPHLVGINNHMGSLLTQHPGHMDWLMKLIKKRQLIFVDSITSDHSVAAMIAQENNIPYLKRDVFFDNDITVTSILEQFGKLIEIARRRGTAVGIGHPYPETMDVLSRAIQDLGKSGIKLVGLKTLHEHRYKGKKQWQTSSSQSPRVAKNLKL
ncbi:MAG: divergent polysaccharide deacetylase family protein [Thiotrichales bacterium]|nr:divergent polysaccharide deacetylase family protein [Thiotrichales bacterium]